MEDNESQPTNVLDMIATDAKPAEITDTLKSMIYAKAGAKVDGMKQYAATSLFGQEPEEPAEPEGPEEPEGPREPREPRELREPREAEGPGEPGNPKHHKDQKNRQDNSPLSVQHQYACRCRCGVMGVASWGCVADEMACGVLCGR